MLLKQWGIVSSHPDNRPIAPVANLLTTIHYCYRGATTYSRIAVALFYDLIIQINELFGLMSHTRLELMAFMLCSSCSTALPAATATLSTATLPTATLPTATLPTATLPTATLPTATLPTATLPTATLPTATFLAVLLLALLGLLSITLIITRQRRFAMQMLNVFFRGRILRSSFRLLLVWITGVLHILFIEVSVSLGFLMSDFLELILAVGAVAGFSSTGRLCVAFVISGT
jgi:hypothetical protein